MNSSNPQTKIGKTRLSVIRSFTIPVSISSGENFLPTRFCTLSITSKTSMGVKWNFENPWQEKQGLDKYYNLRSIHTNFNVCVCVCVCVKMITLRQWGRCIKCKEWVLHHSLRLTQRPHKHVAIWRKRTRRRKRWHSCEWTFILSKNGID